METQDWKDRDARETQRTCMKRTGSEPNLRGWRKSRSSGLCYCGLRLVAWRALESARIWAPWSSLALGAGGGAESGGLPQVRGRGVSPTNT